MFLMLWLALGPLRPGVLAPPMQICIALFPLPAAWDWTVQSLGRRESSNIVRVITGAMLAFAFCDVLLLVLLAKWTYLAIALGVIASYMLGIFLRLLSSNALRRVVEEHFPGL